MSAALRSNSRPGQFAGSPKFCTVKQARAIPRDGWVWGAAHDAAFPDVDPGIRVYAGNVLLQIPLAPAKVGSIHMVDDSRDLTMARTQVGLVRSLGPLAFHNQQTLEMWPSGEWFGVGDFVRFPLFGGDRWYADIPGSNDKIMWVLLRDVHAFGTVVRDPLTIKAYL